MKIDMSYPFIILPFIFYKKRLIVDHLLKKYDDLMVVRLVDGNIDEYIIETNEGEKKLNDKVFGGSIANLSMNLAGGKFDVDSKSHLRFLPITEYGTTIWNGGFVNYLKIRKKGNFSFHSPCFGLCFCVKDIHNKTFPFYKYFNDKNARDVYEKETLNATTEQEKEYDAHLVGEFINKSERVPVYPRIKVHHSPTRANYWHMTLDTYRPTDKDYVKPGEKLNNSDRNMFKALKQDLLQSYDINIAPKYKLSPFTYIYFFDLLSRLVSKHMVVYLPVLFILSILLSFFILPSSI